MVKSGLQKYENLNNSNTETYRVIRFQSVTDDIQLILRSSSIGSNHNHHFNYSRTILR